MCFYDNRLIKIFSSWSWHSYIFTWIENILAWRYPLRRPQQLKRFSIIFMTSSQTRVFSMFGLPIQVSDIERCQCERTTMGLFDYFIIISLLFDFYMPNCRRSWCLDLLVTLSVLAIFLSSWYQIRDSLFFRLDFSI